MPAAITKEKLTTIANAVARANGPQSLKEIIDNPKYELKWDVLVPKKKKGSKSKSNQPAFMFPRVWDNQAGKWVTSTHVNAGSMGPGKVTLVYPPAPISAATVDPKAMADFDEKVSGNGKKDMYLAFTDPTSEGFDAELYSDYKNAMELLNKFFNEDFVHALAHGVDASTGTPVCSLIFDELWEDKDGDKNAIEEYLLNSLNDKSSTRIRRFTPNALKSQ
jgi:hypothetical protein